MSALDSLLEELGVDLTDEDVKLAVANYRNERKYMEDLRRTRESHRLSPETVAHRMGVALQTVLNLEGWDSDPTLQRMRYYANAVGATTKHTVRDADEL